MDHERRFRNDLLAWTAKTPAREFPWRAESGPYEVLIGEILLQRTRGENVVPVYVRFLERWPTPEALSTARTASLRSTIKPLGLEKRTEMLKKLGRALTGLGGIPSQPADLLKLPGVGPYAAHAVPVFSRGANLPLVDWVIARVLRRYFGLAGTKRPNADTELWSLAGRVAEPGRARDLWLGALDLSASFCRPRPCCAACPLELGCHFANAAERALPTP